MFFTPRPRGDGLGSPWKWLLKPWPGRWTSKSDHEKFDGFRPRGHASSSEGSVNCRSAMARNWGAPHRGDEISWLKGWFCLFGGFLKWWYPTTIGFPTKNDHFGVFWGYHYFRKHPFGGEELEKKSLRRVVKIFGFVGFELFLLKFRCFSRLVECYRSTTKIMRELETFKPWLSQKTMK